MSIAMSIWQGGAEMAAHLDQGMLFTDLAQLMTGEEITARVTSRTGRSPLSPDEHRHLESWRDSSAAGARREGELVTSGGRRVARVCSVYLPDRIPDPSVIMTLQCTDVPLGRALFGLGPRRETLESESLPKGPYAFRSRGLLVLPGCDAWPVAMAEELVLREFAALLR